MSKLRIFIEGKELDSLESVTVPITKQFEELSNPTVICNDYSKTVTVPLSKNNNAIFGHCYNPDRLIAAGDEDTPLVGIYFDPYKKLDCRLQWGDDAFFTGYAKMLKVTNNGYEVTINGELGKIFQDLQKITFDKSKYEDEEDIEKYWIDGSKYVNTKINKELVYKCWNSEQDDYTLRETTDSNYDITDIIGFIPNNSYSNDFDYSIFEFYDTSEGYCQKKYEKYMEDKIYDGKSFYDQYNIEPSSIIKDGFFPEQAKEWRSYNQIPFIYWNKFWQIFRKKAEELTGYSWYYPNLEENSVFKNLAITIQSRDEIVSDTEVEKVSDFSLSLKTDMSVDLNYDADQQIVSYIPTIAEGSKYVDSEALDPGDGQILLKIKPYIKLRLYNNIGYTATSLGFTIPYTTVTGVVNTTSYGALKFRWMYGSETLLEYYIVDDSDAAYNLYHKVFPKANILRVSQQKVNVPSGSYIDIILGVLSNDLYIKTNSESHRIILRVTAYNLTSDYSHSLTDKVLFFGTSEGYSFPDRYAKTQSLIISEGDDFTWQKVFFRSNDSFTLNDICNLDFSNILDWCKRYRIDIKVDELYKKIIFSNKVSDISIIDKTADIDISNTFDISPITFDKRYVLFDYNDTETKLSQLYVDTYGLQYGAKKITTNYSFNAEEEKLFEKTTPSILYTPSYIYWDDIKTYPANITYNTYKNIFIDLRDKDGNTTKSSNMYFYPQKTAIAGKTSVFISDDTELMRRTNTYCYIDPSSSYMPYINTTYWTEPNLIDYTNTACCLFEKPVKNYTYNNSYFDNSYTVFDGYWKTYIEERYNIQNKKITTYVRLTPQDFINFKFNQFWKIGNQIYIVNKIYDYDITSDKPTKVDLITVQNIEAYKK